MHHALFGGASLASRGRSSGPPESKSRFPGLTSDVIREKKNKKPGRRVGGRVSKDLRRSANQTTYPPVRESEESGEQLLPRTISRLLPDLTSSKYSRPAA